MGAGQPRPAGSGTAGARRAAAGSPARRRLPSDRGEDSPRDGDRHLAYQRRRLDILREIPSGDRHHPNSYADLVRRATARQFLGCTIYVAALGDIITSDEAADRPKDREALPELRALLAAQPEPAGPTEGE